MRAEPVEQLVQVGALGRHLVFGADLGVDRQQVVAALHLHAVAGVEDDAHLRRSCAAIENWRNASIMSRSDAFSRSVTSKPSLRSDVGHGLRVVDRVLQRADLVGGVADHQRDARVRRPRATARRRRASSGATAATAERGDAAAASGSMAHGPLQRRAGSASTTRHAVDDRRWPSTLSAAAAMRASGTRTY